MISAQVEYTYIYIKGRYILSSEKIFDINKYISNTHSKAYTYLVMSIHALCQLVSKLSREDQFPAMAA